MSGGTIATTIAVGVATAAAGSIASGLIGGAMGGGGGGGGTSGGNAGGSGGLSFQQTQLSNSIKYNQRPSYGANEETKTPNPEMPLQPTKAPTEKAATKWGINSTPTEGVGDQQSKQDANSVWADRLSKYLDYNSRQLG